MKNISFTFIALIALLFTACNSSQRLLEKGNYDQTIDYSIRKLRGKKNKSPKHVQSLEEAFSKVTQRDMRSIETLKRKGTGNIWAKIHDIEQGIANRQYKIEPLLPLMDKNGYQATFAFVKVGKLIEESSKKAAEGFYIKGSQNLTLAREGDKVAARKAFEQFKETKRFVDDYKDVAEHMQEAEELGVIHVLYETKNRVGTMLPRDAERELQLLNVRKLNTRWTQYHTQTANDLVFDYRIELNIEEVNVGGEQLRERAYIDQKEIEEGWEYVLDYKGNVMKDSLGNDIKVPRKVIITAEVLETYQFKNAAVKARLVYYDTRTNERLYSDALTAEAVFENYASTFRGDRRALSNESRNRIGNAPMPFPRDYELVRSAVINMKPALKDKLHHQNRLNHYAER